MKKPSLFLAIVLGTLIVSTAWGADKETIKVGLNLAVAGVFAPLGDGQKKGFDLAAIAGITRGPRPRGHRGGRIGARGRGADERDFLLDVHCPLAAGAEQHPVGERC